MPRTFQVYRDSAGPLHAVSTGPAWLALPVPWLWAAKNRLWFRAFLFLIVDGFLGLLLPALLTTQPVALGLALLVPRLVALIRGTDWVGAAHEDQGREYIGTLVASRVSDAIAQVARNDGRIPPESRPRYSDGGFFAFPPVSMQQLWAVARLTVGAAFRYRLVVVLMALLVGAVIVLPTIIKHDETAGGFTQILLTYTLGIITALLSMVTLWLACGTLARDIDDCHMQVVAAKPIPRWQIWLGKWLGIMALNAMLLGTSAGAVYLLMQWRATQLPLQVQQALHSNILTARASVRDPVTDIEQRAEALIRTRLPELQAKGANIEEARAMAVEMIKAKEQVIPDQHFRRFNLDLRHAATRIQGKPVFVRLKFHTPELGVKRPYEIEINAGPAEGAKRETVYRSLAAEAQHEIQLNEPILNADGTLTVDVANRSGVPLLIPIEDGFELLYPEGGFGLNYVRACLVLLTWLGLLAAIGLSAASFLSFPVAAFLATTVLILGLSTGTLKSVVEDKTVLGFQHDTTDRLYPAIDALMLPIFEVLLKTVNLVQQFSPIDAVSSGRSVTWADVSRAIVVVIFLLGGFFAAIGIIAFTRRELATAQSNH
jgi:ABC-type transport system involved in multi-copper enzyme maturation permease subunit